MARSSAVICSRGNGSLGYRPSSHLHTNVVITTCCVTDRNNAAVEQRASGHTDFTAGIGLFADDYALIKLPVYLLDLPVVHTRTKQSAAVNSAY